MSLVRPERCHVTLQRCLLESTIHERKRGSIPLGWIQTSAVFWVVDHLISAAFNFIQKFVWDAATQYELNTVKVMHKTKNWRPKIPNLQLTIFFSSNRHTLIIYSSLSILALSRKNVQWTVIKQSFDLSNPLLYLPLVWFEVGKHGTHTDSMIRINSIMEYISSVSERQCNERIHLLTKVPECNRYEATSNYHYTVCWVSFKGTYCIWMRLRQIFSLIYYWFRDFSIIQRKTSQSLTDNS